jgi:hypothetical protein
MSYVPDGDVNSLLFDADEDNGRDLCSKKTPRCRRVRPKNESFEGTFMIERYDCQSKCSSKQPKDGTTMKFQSYKNMSDRHFVVCADFKCSLVQTNNADNIARLNSAKACFDNTLDDSRNASQEHNKQGLLLLRSLRN